jgi:quinol-cytochrome oxidoreductase complex cytochrome b subunit
MATTHPEQEKDNVPFFPDHFMTEFYVVIGIIVLAVVIGAIGLFSPVGLQAPADPLDTPMHVKPEWYFLALYQLLKYIPPQIIGIDGPVVMIVGVMLALIVVTFLPFIDKKENSKKAMRNRAIITAVLLIAAVILTVVGEVS